MIGQWLRMRVLLTLVGLSLVLGGLWLRNDYLADKAQKRYLISVPKLLPQAAMFGLDLKNTNSSKAWLSKVRSDNRRMVLVYSTCGGLINQQYAHISAFVLASILKAEVVLPPACFRNSFGEHYDLDVRRNKMQWYITPLDALLDTDEIVKIWDGKGITVHRTPEILETPNLTRPSKAFMRYRGLETLPGALHVSVGDVYQQTQPVSVLVARIRKAVHDRLAALGSIEAASAVSTVYVELPCTFFALRTASILPLATEVSLSLPFNATLDRLALRTVAAMRAAKVPSFNGVHLRMEKDAGDWMVILGGRGAVWSMYLNAMRRVGFNASTPLYVATGLLSYGAEQEWEDAKRVLINARVASSVIIKNQYIPDFELEGLNTEQQALLDFLILARGNLFVGLGSSTFSYYIAQYRHLFGHSIDSSLLVAASRVGTDGMFASSAVVTHKPNAI